MSFAQGHHNPVPTLISVCLFSGDTKLLAEARISRLPCFGHSSWTPNSKPHPYSHLYVSLFTPTLISVCFSSGLGHQTARRGLRWLPRLIPLLSVLSSWTPSSSPHPSLISVSLCSGLGYETPHGANPGHPDSLIVSFTNKYIKHHYTYKYRISYHIAIAYSYSYKIYITYYI